MADPAPPADLPIPEPLRARYHRQTALYLLAVLRVALDERDRDDGRLVYVERFDVQWMLFH